MNYSNKKKIFKPVLRLNHHPHNKLHQGSNPR